MRYSFKRWRCSGRMGCCDRGNAKVFKKYSQMKLKMKREALEKLNRRANETGPSFGPVKVNWWGLMAQFGLARFRDF